MVHRILPTRLCWALSIVPAAHAQGAAGNIFCSAEFVTECCGGVDLSSEYNCSFPGLEHLTPGVYEGVVANYLSFATDRSSPSMRVRADEFEACTGGTVVFAEAQNIWEDPVKDLGTRTSRGSELYDGYFMSYSHFPEVSALGLAENLNERIRRDNAQLKWEDVLPQVKHMGEYRKDGVTNIDFLMYDGDFFVPLIRTDLLERYDIPVPNTWEEVVDYAKFFHGRDLNGDGEADYGFCHFPRIGAGHWDWWFSEAVYSTWATFSQTQGIQQGFFFDKETMEPKIGSGFRAAVRIWKELWSHGTSSSVFPEGRCAIGFGPPGEWKSVLLNPNGVSRTDNEGNVTWRATFKNGEYAEPYRFKPFGSLRVEDPATGEMTPCTPTLCPKAEPVPMSGHYIDDRFYDSEFLPPSPHAGRLINRSPFYWSGGLGTLIRKSSTAEKKDLLWDFFVYTNSPEASVHDVANYKSWLDSWRYSQLFPGTNFIEAGWSEVAYQEHVETMQWALSEEVNGATNIRLPGVLKYTRDVMGALMSQFITEELTLDELVDGVQTGWNKVTKEEGLLDQLDIYRSSLLLDALPEAELCRLHREEMDVRDPSTCRVYDPSSISRNSTLLIGILVPCIVVLLGLLACLVYDRHMRPKGLQWQVSRSELTFSDPPEPLGRGTFGMVVLAEFRGTKVAVKRVIPPKSEGGASVRDPTEFGDEEAPSVFKSSGELSLEKNRLRDQNGSSGSYEPTSTTSGLRSMVNIRRKHRDSKYPRVQETDYAKLKAAFILEMEQLASLRHPCITTVMGAIVTNCEEPMLIMEYMDHGSFYDMLHNETVVFNGELLLTIFRDVAQGMRFLHSSTPPIIHSDLKASNILVDSRFRAKVADFGLTQKRKIGAVGTPYWLSPEVLRGETVNTTHSDAYAFGMIIWEAYARQDPYEGESDSDVLRLVADPQVNKRPPVPATCPAKPASIMSECLHHDARQRPTYEELDLLLKRLEPAAMELPTSEEEKVNNGNLAEKLLNEVFPKPVADALKEGRKVEPESRDIVTIFFSDIVSFTDIASALTPLKVADLLGRLYSRFDDLARKYHVYKVETIGDAYMAVTNLVEDQPTDHAKRIAQFAMDASEAARKTLIDTDDPSKGHVSVRIGFHSGPVVANVIGSLNPRYCLFGDVVNTSARMESTSAPNQIQCSDRTASLLRVQWPGGVCLQTRGLVEIKGKGSMVTYWVGDTDQNSLHRPTNLLSIW